MENIDQQLPTTEKFPQLQQNEQQINSSRLIYENFASKSPENFVGISIQNERLYVVQKKIMSIFQYFVSPQNRVSQKAPVLIKQIFLPFQVSKFIITEKYICLKAKDKCQIRDIEFERLFYSQRKGYLITRTKSIDEDSTNSNGFVFDYVEELELECQIIDNDMISWKVLTKKKSNSQDPKYLREYWSQKYNIFTKHRTIIKCKTEMIDPTNKNRRNQICKSPIFINQLGYIQNFYIWPISFNEIQIGIFFNQKEHENLTENGLYQICSFQLKDINIKNVYYYDFKGLNQSGKPKDGPHLFMAVSQTPTAEKSKVKILIFEIMPEQNIKNNESQNEALNNCLDQFNELKKQKKSQQSISKRVLLNQFLDDDGHSNSPRTIIESYTIKNSSSIKKVFYNSQSKVLWISDTSDLIYRINLLKTGDRKQMRQKNVSFIENIEALVNEQNGPELEGIMYDDYPIFKRKSIILQIALREKYLNSENKPEISALNKMQKVQNNEKQFHEDSKEVIQFDDKELQKIDMQKSSEKIQLGQNIDKQVCELLKQSKQVQIQTEQSFETSVQLKLSPQVQNQQTQTEETNQKIDENNVKQQKQKPNQSLIQITDLSQLLKELNFNKVEDLLIRFSTLFSANVTKNVNKLKQFNNKAKQEIKLKINGDIFELIKQVFTSIMNQALAQKIQKQVGKSKDFVQKIFNKHLEHFNLMMLEQKIKEENVKKLILEEQLRSIDVIKEASMKFLDVTKVRQMQKIAYNEVVVQSIRQVGKKIENLQIKVDQMFRESEQTQKKIINDIKEIKESFKLLIDLEENLSDEEENKKVDDQSSNSGFQSEQEEDFQQERKENKKQALQYKRMQTHPEFQLQQYPLVNPNIYGFNQRPSGWNSSFFQGSANYPFVSNPSSLPPSHSVSHYSPVYSHYTQYQPPNPYESTIQHRQQQYFPLPYPVQRPFSEIRVGSQSIQDPTKGQKKKKSKQTRKKSSSLRNQ